MNTKQVKKLYIVAGAAGEIGTEFCRQLSDRGQDVIAVLRNTPITVVSNHVTSVHCDLSDSASIESSFKTMNLIGYDLVVFIHTIGTDKYNPRGYPHIQKMRTIDPNIYDTNVNTFKYPLRYFMNEIRRIHKSNGKSIQFKAILLGGIPDKFTPFVIEPFCEAKNICRQYIRSAVELYPEWVSGLVVNVSSTITKSALKVRPYADLTYWLTPQEVVTRSIDAVIRDEMGYCEVEVYKHSPEFKEGYYEDSDALYKKWSHDTGVL